MLYKHGVDFVGLQAPMWYALGVMEVIYAKKGEHMVLAVGTDGVHSVPNSLHAKGLAVDLRTRNLSDTIVALMVADAKLILFPVGYDVVNEHHTVVDGVEQPHIHVEYDPKPGRGSYTQQVLNT
jgi:hypothetical protein